MKKIILYLLALAALLSPCISDFSFLGLPWDHEYQKITYPDIAYDMTYIPPESMGQTDYFPRKYSMKYATIKPELITGEIRY